jgi:hypothetical protein
MAEPKRAQSRQPQQQVFTENVVLTPELAAEWLRTNHCNRPLNNKKIEQYSKAIAAGKFPNIGQPIIFGTSKRMLNGQHRCHAVVKTGVAIEVSVARGVEDRFMPLIDAGTSRSLRDVLVIEGWTPWLARVGATAARYAMAFEAGVKINTEISNDAGRDYVFDHPDLMGSVEFIASLPRFPAPVPHSLAAFVHYLFRAVVDESSDEADQFIRQFWTGEDLSANDIILQLRNRLIARTMSGHSVRPEDMAGAIIRVWNSVRIGRPIKYVNNALRSDGTMPRPK